MDHIESDYLANILFLGLCQEYGPDNVIDWPWKGSYHGEISLYQSYYDPNEIGKTEPYNWMIAQPGKPWADEEIFSSIDEFDLVILASPRISNMAALRKLINKVGRKRIKQLVFIDGEDGDYIRHDIVEEFSPSVYFKREMLSAKLSAKCRVMPCPFASPAIIYPNVKKDIDIMNLSGGNYFAGVGKNSILGVNSKEELDNILQNEFKNACVGYLKKGYFDAINRSKMAVCLGGWGWDTLRLWEIPSFETLLLVNKSPLLMPYPFINGEHCIEFETINELLTIIHKYLDNEDERVKIAKAGNEHLRKYHTAKARARYLVEESFR